MPETDQITDTGRAAPAPHRVLHLPPVASLARRAAPVVVEGIVMPTGFFYLGMWLGGVWGGIIAALVWSYAALGRRLVVGGLSGVLLLAVATLSVRALVTGLSGSQFVYFVQPLAGEAALSLLFLVSLPAAKSLTQRLAHDFLPLEGLPASALLRRVFQNITLLWAAVFLLLGLLSWWLLAHNGMSAYVGYRSAVATGVKGLAIAASVLLFRSGLRRQGVRISFGPAA